MNRTRRQFTAVGALALTLVAWGCETGTEPPRSAALQAGGPAAGVLGTELSFANRAVAQLTDEVVRQKIDPEVGGELTLLGHTLTVPAGAIDRPTMFVMSVLAGTTIQVELIAYDPDLYNDVGGKGFNVPVQLALSYAGAGADFDPATATIVHIETDGSRVVVPSTVDAENQVVRAELKHFSRYGLCSN